MAATDSDLLGAGWRLVAVAMRRWLGAWRRLVEQRLNIIGAPDSGLQAACRRPCSLGCGLRTTSTALPPVVTPLPAAPAAQRGRLFAGDRPPPRLRDPEADDLDRLAAGLH